MPHPDEIQFDCIGCGTMNPAGAEVCSGCGHRFAGPEGGRIVNSPPMMAPAPEEARVAHPSPRPVREPTVLGCFVKAIGIILTIIATLVAFVVAFFITCASIGGGDFAMVWTLMAGLGAAGAVVAFAVWIASLFRSERTQSDEFRGRREDR